MACIDNIVTLGLCPDEAASKSGFTLMSAAGMNVNNFADIATDSSGVDMVMEKKALTLLQFKNDFIGQLQANKVVTTISEPTYNTSTFNTGATYGTYSGERGIVLHKSNAYHGSLRKTYLKAIEVYPLASGDGEIKIVDGYNTYTWDVTFVAHQVNVFDEETLSGFPYELEPTSGGIKVLIDNSTISFAKSPITCLKGCNGTLPNECGWADGWDGTGYVKYEGYGINLQFYCHCDYEQVICDLSNTFTGELIWLKWQINVYEEMYKSNRFDNWTIYSHDDINKIILPDLDRKYRAKWQALMDGMLGILKIYRDDCLSCQGIRWVTNI